MFGLTFTYSGHPVSARVASETLRIYEEDKIVEHVQALEPFFLGSLKALLSHPLVGEVRGRGLLAGVELVADKDSKKAFDANQQVGKYCVERAEFHGLILRAIGDTISFCPPLIITESEVVLLMARFKQALDDTLEMVQN